MSNRKHTSRAIAELASKTLRDPKASKRGKSLAGSALAQAKARRTGAKSRAATA
jgi:hypothetical protein